MKLTTVLGHTLTNCLKPGVDKHYLGIMALDAECYTKFSEMILAVAKA